MLSLSASSRAELLAALQLQYEWGVVDVIEDVQWAAATAAPPRDVGRAKGEMPREAGRERAGQKDNAADRAAVSRPAASGGGSWGGEGASAETLLAAPDLASLVRVSEAMEGVGLARTATHRLAPVFVADAPFMVIGEIPDADEDRSGLLLQGRAGALFDRMLGAIGLERAELSMAPAVPWRPPGGRPATESELRACLPLLQRSIALCRPPFLVTLGSTPARLLLGEGTVLGRVRGKWWDVEIPGCATRTPLLALNHPLQLTVSPAIRRNVWHDLLILASKIEMTKREPK